MTGGFLLLFYLLATVKALILSADGKMLVTGCWDTSIRVWDIRTGECVREWNDPDRISTVSLSADGKTAASGGLRGVVRIWDVETGECVRELKGHSGEICAVSLSADGKMLVSGSCGSSYRIYHGETDTSVRVWDVVSENV